MTEEMINLEAVIWHLARSGLTAPQVEIDRGERDNLREPIQYDNTTVIMPESLSTTYPFWKHKFNPLLQGYGLGDLAEDPETGATRCEARLHNWIKAVIADGRIRAADYGLGNDALCAAIKIGFHRHIAEVHPASKFSMQHLALYITQCVQDLYARSIELTERPESYWFHGDDNSDPVWYFDGPLPKDMDKTAAGLAYENGEARYEQLLRYWKKVSLEKDYGRSGLEVVCGDEEGGQQILLIEAFVSGMGG